MWSALADVLVCSIVVGALALPGLALLPIEPPVTRLAVAVALGLIAFYLAAGAVYFAGLPWPAMALLPLGAAGWAWTHRPALAGRLRDPALRPALVGLLLVGAGTLFAQALIVSYSGGGWAGDWFEHYQRARFFLLRLPADQVFLDLYTLPARPPLANLLVAGLLGLGGSGFASFQVFTTLLSALVFLPLAAFLESRPDGARATRLLAVLLLLNPLFLHNATYPWTKLTAAVFALTGVLLLWRARENPTLAAWALPVFAAGVIAHYSVATWGVAFGAAGAWALRGVFRSSAFRRSLAWGGVAAVALAGTWFAWAIARYGLGPSIEATSTVGHAPQVSWLRQVAITLENIRHTLVPNWDSEILANLLKQPHALSRWRDLGFTLYQQNLPMALGLGNLVALAWVASRPRSARSFETWVIGAFLVVVLGIAVHTWPVDLGLTHISLQPLVLLGLTWIAAEAPRVPRVMAVCWSLGLAVDFAWGCVLHFGTQSLLLPGLLAPGNNDRALIWFFTGVDMNNYNAKLRVGEPFLAELAPDLRGWLVLGFLGVLALAGACLAAAMTARSRALPARVLPVPA